MKNLTLISLTFGLLVSACGDNEKGPADAGKAIDAPETVIPAAPTLGVAIDRMGRPAVNTALNAPLNDDPLKTAKKDAYNHATTAAMWGGAVVDSGGNDVTAPSTILGTGPRPKTVIGEFARNLALFDSLDQGTPLAVGTTPSTSGCGNAATFTLTDGYSSLAAVLADDALYVDTAKLACGFYLSLEVEVATGGGIVHSQCGGRTLTHDVVDVSYSLLAAGLKGFDANNMLAPLVHDGVPVHTDVNNDVFPFLGAPH
jgi:hypothetical protein